MTVKEPVSKYAGAPIVPQHKIFMSISTTISNLQATIFHVANAHIFFVHWVWFELLA
jgi:hypothetical protein